jgi:hypothetical protein
MLLGLLVGLMMWVVLSLVALWRFGLWDLPWLAPVVAVFTSGVVAGYVGRRAGLLLGGIIGSADLAVQLGLLFAMSALRDLARSPAIWLVWIGTSILPGTLGGYLGQTLARVKIRRARSPNQRAPH